MALKVLCFIVYGSLDHFKAWNLQLIYAYCGITLKKSEADYGAAKVMLRPASPGTRVIAGGAVRIVLELAGVENALGKQLGSNKALNNARATVVAVQKMRQFREVAEERGIPMEELWK
ncbi:30S ribosomal protein S5 [Forsythia ovata]|uniref:30S ribosomal protein S5 n=1 Tax=Forsythia ovata TaxID=205694 RepID=A0ABD1QBL5_9LAMI